MKTLATSVAGIAFALAAAGSIIAGDPFAVFRTFMRMIVENPGTIAMMIVGAFILLIIAGRSERKEKEYLERLDAANIAWQAKKAGLNQKTAYCIGCGKPSNLVYCDRCQTLRHS